MSIEEQITATYKDGRTQGEYDFFWYCLSSPHMSCASKLELVAAWEVRHPKPETRVVSTNPATLIAMGAQP